MKPLAIDLFAGLGGWSEALRAEGYDVVGFDIERHVYGEHCYPAQLVVQDVLTLHGSQFRDATLIVASPPCQFFSYTAMPWSRAKALAAAVRAEPGRLEKELALFNACFRIQREACEAAGHHIPMVVENVRGAIPWVGRSRWNFGSFHLWGDVPALMPMTFSRAVMKQGVTRRPNGATNFHGIKSRADCAPRQWSERTAATAEDAAAFHLKLPGSVEGQRNPGFRFDGSGRSFQTASVNGIKGVPHRTAGHWTNPAEHVKCGGDWFNDEQPSISRLTSSKSPARKAASAMIAKIPAPLAAHIARTFYPR